MIPQPSVVYNAAIGLAAQGNFQVAVDGITLESEGAKQPVYVETDSVPTADKVADFVPQPDGNYEMRIPGLGVTAVATQAEMTAIMNQLKELEMPPTIEVR